MGFFTRGRSTRTLRHDPPPELLFRRIYVTDISQREAIGRVHGDVFAHIRPATAMLEVSRLIDPAMLVEIEADAIVAHDFNG